MIELPESATLSEQMHQTLAGKTIRHVEAGRSPHRFAFYHGAPEDYPARLVGKQVGGARAYGGQVELSAEDMRLVLHDGVNVRYFYPEEEPPQKHQLLLAFEDGSALVCTVQMYGGLHAFRDGENDNPYYQVAKEKPSPLLDAFDRRYFESMARQVKPAVSVKALLATQQRIPGLGNGVLQDILFRARVNPKTKCGRLTVQEWDGLFRSVKETLAEMTVKGGRDTEKDLFGCPGGYRSILSAKTAKTPCPVCGGEIVRQAYMGGNVYYCPVCQPVRA